MSMPTKSCKFDVLPTKVLKDIITAYIQDSCFSVPQGSLCGPVLYYAYTSMMNTIVPPDIAIHAYADDHALKKEFNSAVPQDEVETAESLIKCLDKVKDWMNSCCL